MRRELLEHVAAEVRTGVRQELLDRLSQILQNVVAIESAGRRACV